MATYYSCNLVDTKTNTVIANGYQSILSTSIQSFITAVTTNTDYTASVNFANGSTSNHALDFSLTIRANDCLDLPQAENGGGIKDLSFWVFTSSNLTPSIIITDYGHHKLTLLDPGNCSTKICFTTDELEELYQKALNMCKICNCTK